MVVWLSDSGRVATRLSNAECGRNEICTSASFVVLAISRTSVESSTSTSTHKRRDRELRTSVSTSRRWWPWLNHTCTRLRFLLRFSVASLQAHHADNTLQD